MFDNIHSKNGDKIVLQQDPKGVLVGIIPKVPPKNDAYDCFQLNIRFTNVARVATMLEKGGTYTADLCSSTITTKNGEYIISMPFEHDPSSRFTVVLDKQNSETFATFFRQTLTGKTIPPTEDDAFLPTTTPERVGRNDPCPCGSGRKYKRCCISLAPQDTPQLEPEPKRIPPELRPLAESNDPTCREFILEFQSNPGVVHDAEFWHGAGCTIMTLDQPYAATACLEIAHRLAPSNNEVLLNLAATKAICESQAEALELIDKVSHTTSRRAAIRGNILQDLGRHEEAIAEYQRAIDEEPDFFLPYARLLISLRATDSATYEYWLERAVEAVPKSPWIAEYFVRHCRAKGRLDTLADADWLNYLQAGYRLDVAGRSSEDPQLILNCQVIHLAARALRDRSLDILKQAVGILQAVPNHLEICDAGRFIAEVAANLGMPDGVAAGWSRICKHCAENLTGLPKSGLVTYQVAAHMNCGETEQAVRLCEEAGGAEADDPAILGCYWWGLDDLDRTSEAIPVAERLVAIGEADSPLFYNLGFLCGKEGAFGKARYYYQKEVALSPSNFMAWENLSFVHLLAAEMNDAERCYQQYMSLRNEQIVESTPETWADDRVAQDGYQRVDLEDDTPSSDAAREHCSAKDGKFKSLLLTAEQTLGSMSYTADLIAANNATKPILGSYTNLKPVFLSPEQILANLASGGACTEELQFHAASAQRADFSAAIASIQEHFPRLRTLPESSQKSLLEAEQAFQVKASIDFSPAIVAYAKSVEICLYDCVFKSFKECSGADFRIEQHVKAVLADPQSKAIRLARFVEAGHALELGTMTFLLQLCRGRTAQRIPLLAALREHILESLAAPAVLDKDYLDTMECLASRFRNKAAHEQTFDAAACGKVRAIVFHLLEGLPT